MEQRLREFDFIRAFAALSVIAIHITGRYIYGSSIWLVGAVLFGHRPQTVYLPEFPAQAF